jgi:hypothetical protein
VRLFVWFSDDRRLWVLVLLAVLFVFGLSSSSGSRGGTVLPMAAKLQRSSQLETFTRVHGVMSEDVRTSTDG